MCVAQQCRRRGNPQTNRISFYTHVIDTNYYLKYFDPNNRPEPLEEKSSRIVFPEFCLVGGITQKPCSQCSKIKQKSPIEPFKNCYFDSNTYMFHLRKDNNPISKNIKTVEKLRLSAQHALHFEDFTLY